MRRARRGRAVCRPTRCSPRGSFGQAVLAQRLRGGGGGGRFVALKVVWKAALRGEGGRSRWAGWTTSPRSADAAARAATRRASGVGRLLQMALLEREVLARSPHPFVVRLYECFQDEKALYLTLEYGVGGTLAAPRARARRARARVLRALGRDGAGAGAAAPERGGLAAGAARGGLPEPAARFYACELLLALRHVHLHRVLHRDVRLSNVLVDAHGHAKLADFGAATRLRPAGGGAAADGGAGGAAGGRRGRQLERRGRARRDRLARVHGARAAQERELRHARRLVRVRRAHPQARLGRAAAVARARARGAAANLREFGGARGGADDGRLVDDARSDDAEPAPGGAAAPGGGGFGVDDALAAATLADDATDAPWRDATCPGCA